jgi:hypothetical protein
MVASSENGYFFKPDSGFRLLDSFQTREEKITFNPRVIITVASVNSIFANRFGIQLTDGAFIGLRGICSSNQFAKISDCIIFFQDGGNDRSPAHEFNEFAIKGTCPVNCIKFACFFS